MSRCAHLFLGGEGEKLCGKNAHARINQPHNEVFSAVGCGPDCREFRAFDDYVEERTQEELNREALWAAELESRMEKLKVDALHRAITPEEKKRMIMLQRQIDLHRGKVSAYKIVIAFIERAKIL